VGGWLLVLCVLLLVWQPISLSLVASSAIGSFAARGPALALFLLVRVLVTAAGIGAGLALLGGRPGAVGFAKLALVASAATDVFVYTTPYFPNNWMPSDRPVVVALSLAYHAAWLAYLFRSKRVRHTY
jgi:hypothetical protein